MITPPWSLITPFGIPVVPEVNIHLSISSVVKLTPVPKKCPIFSVEAPSNVLNGKVFTPPISAGTLLGSPVINMTLRFSKSPAISSRNGKLPGSTISAINPE